MNDIFKGYGVEVTLPDKDAFLKVKETLTRMGVASKKDNTLYQSCHILHKQGFYAIVHFKEMFALYGKPTSITENDLSRRNAIVKLLDDWDLLDIIDLSQIQEPPPIYLSQIKIISHKEKADWTLVPKYSIGTRK